MMIRTFILQILKLPILTIPLRIFTCRMLNRQNNGPYHTRTEILPPGLKRADMQDIAKSYARTFASKDGQRVLNHLQISIFHRALGPDSSDLHIRHLEGQRYMLGQILRFIERGKK